MGIGGVEPFSGERSVRQRACTGKSRCPLLLAARLTLCIFVILLICFVPCQAQQWSGILLPVGPSNKNVSQSAIDWTNVGIPGGIPSSTWAQCGSTIQASTYGNGSIDATAGIQTALNACTSSHFVLLSAGTFLINSSGSGSPILTIPSSVVLRGAGANQTVLNSTGTNSDGIISVGAATDPGRGYGTNDPVTNSVNITSGATAGSTSVVVSSSVNFTVGGNALISETNDPTYVTKVGGSGSCTYCDGFWNGDRGRGQIVEVTSISGTTIGITPALYTAYTLSPQALPFQPTKYSGVENLQVFSNNTHNSAQRNQTFQLYSCAYCWLKGVEANYTDGDYVKIFWGYRDEVRDSYFTNGFNHGPGQNNNAVVLYFKTTASLIENNIIERAENPVMSSFGPAGNVIAYNYATGGWGVPATITVSFEPHSEHDQFTLYEGNIGPQLWLDVGHGSTSQTTTFRNWWLGTSFVCGPTNDTRATVNCSGAGGNWSKDGARAITDDSLSTYANFVGDIVGSAAQEGLSTSNIALLRWPSARSYSGTQYGLNFGYTLYGDTGSNSLDSATPSTTSFIHGIYNNVDSSTTWAGGVTHTLPASFYRKSKPSWWGNSIPWPPIGPDVTAGIGPGDHTNMNPAESCFYDIMRGVEGGGGSPLTFNANSCYAQDAVQPPTGLTATVR
jgi:hypothetical protein